MQLMKSIKALKQASLFYPRLVYYYKTGLQTLQEFLLCPYFFPQNESTEYDVYNRNIWKYCLDYEGKPFVSLPLPFICWFQPFKHTQHAEGAMYLTILNLPWQERYLYFIGCDSWSQLHINSFLEPFVKRWCRYGRKFQRTLHKVYKHLFKKHCCDARKVCGFLAHNAYRGCSRCLSFPTIMFGEKTDYTNTQ